MKALIRTILSFGLATCAVYFLVACGKNGPRSVSPAAQSGGRGEIGGYQTSSPRPAISPQGTSDTGGGNGTEGRVYESYVIDPLQTPAYQEHLKPVLALGVASVENEPDMITRVFKMKTWYVAPVELEKINRDVLGVSFHSSATEQIALQTKKEVWIDKAIFDRMTVRQQGELLLHEMVMSLYFLKFMPLKELCLNSILVMGEREGEGCDSKAVDVLSQLAPPENQRSLNSEDYERIRYVTGWILKNASGEALAKDLIHVLYANGFDRRIFNPKSETEDAPQKSQMTLTAKEFRQAITATKVAGNMPVWCGGNEAQGDREIGLQACQVRLSESPVPVKSVQLPGYRMQVQLSAPEPLLLEIPFFVGEMVDLSTWSDMDGEESYVFLSPALKSDAVVGDRFYSFAFVFKKAVNAYPRQELVLDSIILQPGVITAVNTGLEVGCQVQRPKAAHFADRPIVIRHKNAKPSLVEHMYSEAPPVAVCVSGETAPAISE